MALVDHAEQDFHTYLEPSLFSGHQASSDHNVHVVWSVTEIETREMAYYLTANDDLVASYQDSAVMELNERHVRNPAHIGTGRRFLIGGN